MSGHKKVQYMSTPNMFRMSEQIICSAYKDTLYIIVQDVKTLDVLRISGHLICSEYKDTHYIQNFTTHDMFGISGHTVLCVLGETPHMTYPPYQYTYQDEDIKTHTTYVKDIRTNELPQTQEYLFLVINCLNLDIKSVKLQEYSYPVSISEKYQYAYELSPYIFLSSYELC